MLAFTVRRPVASKLSPLGPLPGIGTLSSSLSSSKDDPLGTKGAWGHGGVGFVEGPRLWPETSAPGTGRAACSRAQRAVGAKVSPAEAWRGVMMLPCKDDFGTCTVHFRCCAAPQGQSRWRRWAHPAAAWGAAAWTSTRSGRSCGGGSASLSSPGITAAAVIDSIDLCTTYYTMTRLTADELNTTICRLGLLSGDSLGTSMEAEVGHAALASRAAEGCI